MCSQHKNLLCRRRKVLRSDLKLKNGSKRTHNIYVNKAIRVNYHTVPPNIVFPPHGCSTMTSLAVRTPPRLVRNSSHYFLGSNGRARAEHRGERARSFSFDEEVKVRNDEIYHASPERTGSKETLSPRQSHSPMKRSHSVAQMGRTTRNRTNRQPSFPGIYVDSSFREGAHKPGVQNRNKVPASARLAEADKENRANRTGNNSNFETEDTADYVVDALSRARKKKAGGQLMVRWILDRDCQICFSCHEDFSVVRRKHHCRACGGVFCGTCSRWKKVLPHLGYTDKETRVCKWCYEDQHLAEKCAGVKTLANGGGDKENLHDGENRPIFFTKVAPKWVDDSISDHCQQCAKDFGQFVRRHHCRGCGALTCHACTIRKISMPEYGYLTPVRACVTCSSPKILSTSIPKTSGGSMEITGRNLGAVAETISIEVGSSATICEDVEVLIPGHKIRCSVPPGTGKQNQIDVTVCRLTGVSVYCYAEPVVAATTEVYTRGGELTVTGDNFGSERELLLVEWFNSSTNNWSEATGVEILVPHRIFKCNVGAGAGKHALLRVSVSSQSSRGTFSYMPPQIVETSPVSGAGGKIDIVGLNFGAKAEVMSVRVGQLECSDIKIVVPHTKVSCIVPRCPNDQDDAQFKEGQSDGGRFSYHSRRQRQRSNSGDTECQLIVKVEGQEGAGKVYYVNEKQVAAVKLAKNVSKRQNMSTRPSGMPVANDRRRHVLEKAPWLPSENVIKCMLCEGAFGWLNRKHHCRNCGIVVCRVCSSNNQYVAAYRSMQRVCKKCFRAILSDREEMEVLHAEMEHVHALQSVEVGKQVQLQQQLSLLRLQSADGNMPEIERLEALLREQERRADGKQRRYDQLHARLRHLQLIVDGGSSEKMRSQRSRKLSDSVPRFSPTNGTNHQSAFVSTAGGGVGEVSQNDQKRASVSSPSASPESNLAPQRVMSRKSSRASPPIPLPLPREVIAVAKEEAENSASEVLESSGLLRGRALSDYSLCNYSQSPVRSWVGAAKPTLRQGDTGRKRGTPVWIKRMRPSGSVANGGSSRGSFVSASSSLIVAKFRGNKCVLKELPMTDEKIRKKIEREVAVRGMFRAPLHPGVAPLDAVFYDNSTARMYMHYKLDEVGTMADWLEAATPASWDIQSVFQQIFAALAYVHSHQIAHQNINLESVYIGIVGDASGELARPFISDFTDAVVVLSGGHALKNDGHQSMKKSRGNVESGNGASFLAPEIIAGGEPTFASDLWSVGVMLYKATFGTDQQPVPLGGHHAPIPETKNPRLRELLASILQVEPKNRMSAQACTAHPYFTVSFAREIHESGNIISTEEKINTFRSHLSTLPRPDAVQFLRLRRSHLVYDVLDRFKSFSVGNLQKRLIVMYENEPGVDAGGLTKDMFCRFFDGLMSSNLGFFECCSEASAGKRSKGRVYLPCGKANAASDAAFEALGKLLAKVIFDGQTICAPFPESFFKCLLGLPVSFRDLEEYDPELYHQLYANILNKSLTPEYSQALSLDFYGLIENGEDRVVTESNKREYLRLTAKQKLIGERAKQFEMLKRGFNVFRFENHLKRFNAADLLMLVSGPSEITAEMVIQNIDFSHGNWRNSKTLEHIQQYIFSLDRSKIKRFLQFATGSPNLPLGGLGQDCEGDQPSMGKITFTRLPKSTRLPEAHTCFNCIDLSDYQDYNLLRRSFDIAIENYAETFDLL